MKEAISSYLKDMKEVDFSRMEIIIHQVFDDLVDECSICAHKALNGNRVKLHHIAKDAIRVKEDLLIHLRKARSRGRIDNSSDALLRLLGKEVKNSSLNLVKRLSDLGN